MADLHIVPVGDLIEHDTDGECACGTTDRAVKRDDGSVGWIAVHHSLDGRERPRHETTLIVLINERDLGEA